MDRNIQLLDCTLRDGAYIVNSKFGTPAIKGIINKLQDADVDIIECGWLKNSEHIEGTSFFHVPNDLKNYISEKNKDVIYTVMIDWDRYDLKYLPEKDNESVDAVRIVFPHGKHIEGIAVGIGVKEKGYEVFYQAANTLAYTDDELIDLANAVNAVMPYSLSVVDTFGAMYSEDLERIVKILDRYLKPEIKLGFHSHNNQQLSFALTMQFVEILCESERGVIVDSSLCGMGRGAGNATTELVANYLNRKHNGNYDMNAIMDAIDVYMQYFMQNYSWGYSTPYFIAGMYCCHVNNIAYLLENHRTNSKDMRNIIESLTPDQRKKYDYDLLEKKYIENQSRLVDDEDNINELKRKLAGRKIVLVAPGKSSVVEMDRVKKYISDNNAVAIAVNAIISGYDYDYMFITNSARYDYAKSTYKDVFGKVEKIISSNVKKESDEGECIINFNNVIKRGWEHFDNAMICCLRLMEKLHLTDVAVAGFDGFKEVYNESYADAMLPSLNVGSAWGELNDEVRDMYQDFKRTAKYCRNVNFLTESYFE